MTWSPVQQQHAIERVRIDIAFTEQLPGRVVESAKRIFEQTRTQVRFSEPSHQEVHQLQIQPGVIHAPTAQKVVGWQAIRESSSGVIVEAISLNPVAFSYESTDYRSWTTAYKRFHSVAADIIKQFATVVDFRSFALDYVDRFVYQGALTDAAPNGILRDELLACTTEGARNGKFLWHVHRGWFEKQDGRLILVNQNVDAQDAKSHTGTDVRSIQIFTRAEFRPDPEQFTVEELEEVSNKLHTLCNRHFSLILTDSAKQMVGLRA